MRGGGGGSGLRGGRGGEGGGSCLKFSIPPQQFSVLDIPFSVLKVTCKLYRIKEFLFGTEQAARPYYVSRYQAWKHASHVTFYGGSCAGLARK